MIDRVEKGKVIETLISMGYIALGVVACGFALAVVLKAPDDGDSHGDGNGGDNHSP